MTSSFVFIYILALFPRKQLSTISFQHLAKPFGWRRPRCVGSAMSRRDRSRRGGQFARTAPSVHRRRPGATSAPAHDFLSLSFVFIYILALFPQISLSAFNFQLSAIRSPENHAAHVIPAKAGIHLCPDQQWVPAFAGTTLISIASSGPEAHGNSIQSSPSCRQRHPETMKMREAPWSAAA